MVISNLVLQKCDISANCSCGLIFLRCERNIHIFDWIDVNIYGNLFWFTFKLQLQAYRYKRFITFLKIGNQTFYRFFLYSSSENSSGSSSDSCSSSYTYSSSTGCSPSVVMWATTASSSSSFVKNKNFSKAEKFFDITWNMSWNWTKDWASCFVIVFVYQDSIFLTILRFFCSSHLSSWRRFLINHFFRLFLDRGGIVPDKIQQYPK